MQDTNPLQPVDSMIGKLLVASTTMQDPVLSRSVCLVVHQDTENVFGVLLNRPMVPPKGLSKILASPGQPSADRRTRPIGGNPHPYPSNLPGPDLPGPESPGPESSTHLPPDADDDPLPTVPSEEDKQSVAENTISEASKTLGTIHFGGPLSGPVVAVHNSSELAEAEAGRGVYLAAQRELLETLVKQKPNQFRLIVGHLGWSVEQLQSERDAGFWHMIDATEDDVFIGDHDLWPAVIRRATTASVTSWLGIRDTPFAAEVN